MNTHYDALKVTRDAEDVVIESAYRALMKRYHPDKAGDDPAAVQRAKEINAAYSTLRDPDARARYDRSLTDRESHFDHSQDAGQSPPPSASAAPSSFVQRTPRSPIPTVLFLGFACLIGVGAIGSIMRLGSGSSRITEATSTELETSSTPSDDSSARLLSQATEPLPKRTETEAGEMRNSARDRTPPAAAPSTDDLEALDGEKAKTTEQAPSKVAPKSTPADLEGLY